MDASLRFVRRIIPATGTSFVVPPPPSFPLAGALIDFWFTQGLYYDNGTVADATGELSCSRASIGYAKTQAGTLTQFGTDTLRITNLGLFVEYTKQNLQTYSQAFNTNWVAIGLTSITDNATTAPDGTTTAASIVENSSSGTTHYAIRSLGLTVATYVYSVFMKQGTRRYGALCAEGVCGIIVDLQTGSVTATDGSLTSNVETFGDGWFRVSIIFTGIATSIPQIIGPCDAATPSGGWSGNKPVYNGNGTGSVYVWGAQAELGSFASSYIPTTEVSATRATDLDIPVVGNALYNLLTSTGPGTLYMDVIESMLVPGDDGIFGLSLGPQHWLVGNNTQVTSWIGAGGVMAANLGSGSFDTGIKAAIAWDASGRSLVGNAGTVSSDATTYGLGAQTYSIGLRDVTRVPPGFLCRRLVAWNSRLSDTAIQTLTTP